MKTTHRVIVGDARDMSTLEPDSVDLVVTSPPYPMVEMWDDQFSAQSPTVANALEAGNGASAFYAMHAVLDDVWTDVERVLVDGGIACVNVGDAVRSIGGHFRQYPNHVRIVDAFTDRGFVSLPDIVWRKPANSAAKFMGSGMLPPNAYTTLEHEYVLVFRNGPHSRSFEPHADERYEAAYFWEERNQWFSDVWTDVRGAVQNLDSTDLRDRSAAFPFTLPYRLINMYSVYGDTVLDPFWGTGTTTLAAAAAARNSVGVERDEAFTTYFEDRVEDLPAITRDVNATRLNEHRAFVQTRTEEGKALKYHAEHYEFPVTTKQERRIRFYGVDTVERQGSTYHVTHQPYSGKTSSNPEQQTGRASRPATLDRFESTEDTEGNPEER